MADLLMKMPVPYEPKKKNRFILRFDSSLGINEWYVESTSRPQITINAVEVPFLNTSTYVAGRFTWGTINVTFRDPIGPSAAQALMEWVRMHAESVGTFLTDVNFNDLSYSDDGLANIAATLRPDRCILVY